MACYICHMARTKKSNPTRYVARHDVSVPVVIVTDSLYEKKNRTTARKIVSQEGRWVVQSAADDFTHYVSVITNLSSSADDADPSVFRFLRAKLKEGLPKAAFDRIRSVLATTKEELSSVVDIPVRTVARRERFTPEESERLLRIASAFQKALELFEDVEKARRWFRSEKVALSGLTPLECCDTEPGAKEVENLLGRLEEGVFA